MTNIILLSTRNDDYAFVDPAKKRIDRLDQAFSPQDGTQSQQNGNPPPQDNVKKEESASVNAKDISIDIDSNK
jgi:hypothetical protein